MPTDEQRALIDAVARLLDAEPRIEAAWLAGSLGAGRGDAFSDVDVLILAADGTADAVSKSLADRLAEIVRPVLVNSLLGGRVLSVVTDDWRRFDLSVIEGDSLAGQDARLLTPLFDKGGRQPPVQPDLAYRTAPDQLRRMVEEFLRILGLAIVVIGREEYVVALTGLEHLRCMALDLMLEENGIAPSRRGGALHRNPFLTAEQREALEGLPPQSAERESLIRAQQALAALFLPRAKRFAGTIGMDWPAELEAATRRAWAEKLDRAI